MSQTRPQAIEPDNYSSPTTSAPDTHLTDGVAPAGSHGDVSAQDQASKRRNRTPRAVNSLSQAQLDRKRANDREAQRAIRERTKNRLESLESKIVELESGNEGRLQAALRDRDALYTENVDMRKRLGLILEIVAPIIPADTADKVKALVSPTTIHHLSHEVYPALPADAEYGRVTAGDSENVTVANMRPSSPRTSAPSYQTLSKAQRASVSGMTPNTAVPAFAGSSTQQTPYVTPPYQQVSPQLHRTQLGTANRPLFPRHTSPSCQFDELLFRFVNQCRQQANNGLAQIPILGLDHLDLTAFVYSNGNAVPNELDLSSTAIMLCNAFPAGADWREKIAMIYCTYVTLRWTITQSTAHFNAMPEFLRPIADQIQTPHSVWIDYVPWQVIPFPNVHPSGMLMLSSYRPSMRSELIRHDSIHLEYFWQPFYNSLNVNWPVTNNSDIWSCLEEDSGEIHLKDAFIHHLSDLRNWTMDSVFAEALPMLANTCQIKRSVIGPA